jgi:hypothetical protein
VGLVAVHLDLKRNYETNFVCIYDDFGEYTDDDGDDDVDKTNVKFNYDFLYIGVVRYR